MWRYALERTGLKVRSKIECVWMKMQRVELRKVDEFKYLGVREFCNVYFRGGDTDKKREAQLEVADLKMLRLSLGVTWMNMI